MSNLNEYQIYQWQGSISGAANVPWPVIYIKPDDSLLDFAKKNNNALLVKISNTSSIYDGKSVQGLFFTSANIPNNRSNFSEKTGLCTILLYCDWYSYPPQLGSAEIFGLYGGVPVAQIEKNLMAINNLDSSDTPLQLTSLRTPSESSNKGGEKIE
jgi:hypothetical protein